jgi:hypothetical protein
MMWCGGAGRPFGGGAANVVRGSSRRRAWSRVGYLGISGLMLLAGCTATRPSRPGDLCSIFGENPEWYEEARDSYRRWGVPVPLQLAVINRESGFESDARPPRDWYLGFIPGPRPSSAYGYGQVLDATWDWYRETTGEPFADRDDFGDVTDFIGWYGDVGQRRHGIRKDDPYSFYLSYHLGHAGFSRSRRRRPRTVEQVAREVVAQAGRYSRQYQSCRATLDHELESSPWWPFD